MKKSLPVITWQNIAPPYHEYEYFQECERYPFHATSEHFHLINAWWLCEAATLAYAQEDFAIPRFQRAGLPEIVHFNGESTDCYVASNNAWIIIAFRGTETRRRSEAQDFQHILADIKADCNILLVDSGHNGKVHQGFHNALDEIWDDLLSYLTTLHTAQRPLWITGHSLGAALATLAAGRYHNVQGVYTFGSPRVGDADFSRHFSVRTYRVVHNNDIVTGVPLPGLYRHVGELWYIDSDGVLQQTSDRYEMWMDGVRGEMRNITQSVEQATQGTYNYVPGGLKDHVPLLYAIHLWNNMHSGPGTTK